MGSESHPVRLVVDDDLRRSRLTVFLRALLTLPHAVWALLWTVVAFAAAVVQWLVVLVTGRSSGGLHRFLAAYVRYVTHVHAYLFLAANPFPGFTGAPGYPVDVELPEPGRRRRWTTALRLLLALPALVLARFLVTGGGGGAAAGDGSREGGAGVAVGVALACAFLAWFVSLVRGRTAPGLRDLTAYAIGYAAQAWAYALLLTDRYPNSDPEALGPGRETPAHPIRVRIDDDLRRSRLTVLFRLLLVLPHLVWLLLWSIAAVVAGVLNWIATLLAGRSPNGLHRFLAAYVRYAAQVYGFLSLAANPFPGFTGAAGYPVELEVDPPRRQRRLVTLFRLPLVLPAALVSSALGTALGLAAFFGWFAALVTGRMPTGLRNLAVLAIRYSGQVSAYLWLLTDRYPNSSPALAPPQPPPGEPVTTADLA